MSPRARRLQADLAGLRQLAGRGGLSFRCENSPPDRYEVMFHVAGLALAEDGAPMVRRMHRCAIYLHLDYPRRPPVVTWLTPVFHPNILPPERNGGVCLGRWSAGESLADVVDRLLDLVAYRALNAEDPLDHDAARWATAHGVMPGTEVATLAGRPLPADTPVTLTVGGCA